MFDHDNFNSVVINYKNVSFKGDQPWDFDQIFIHFQDMVKGIFWTYYLLHFVLVCFYFLRWVHLKDWPHFLSESDRERFKEFHIKRKQNTEVTKGRALHLQQKQSVKTARSQRAPAHPTQNVHFRQSLICTKQCRTWGGNLWRKTEVLLFNFVFFLP